MKIVHIITSLGDGGAENTLYKICKYDSSNKHIIVSLIGYGKYYSLIKELKIEVHCLNLKFYTFYKIFFLLRILHNLKPDIIQTWLVHGDFIGGIASRLIGIKNIIWNIRYSNLEFGQSKLITIILIKLLTKLSFIIPKKIIIVSKKAEDYYTKEGFDKSKFVFIPNGYDLNVLKPDKKRLKNFKKNQKKIIPIIGNVARYHPKKDHNSLLEALHHLRTKDINFTCILVGTNIDRNNIKLVSEIKRLNLSKHVKLLGQNDNITKIMNKIDVYVQSSSYGEGFPNVVAESMACETPCVVTNVGDASYIVGSLGWVSESKNSIQLAKNIERSLLEINSDKWFKRCKNSRLRIKSKFDISIMIKSYNHTWKKIYQNEN